MQCLEDESSPNSNSKGPVRVMNERATW